MKTKIIHISSSLSVDLSVDQTQEAKPQNLYFLIATQRRPQTPTIATTEATTDHQHRTTIATSTVQVTLKSLHLSVTLLSLCRLCSLSVSFLSLYNLFLLLHLCLMFVCLYISVSVWLWLCLSLLELKKNTDFNQFVWIEKNNKK